MTNHTAERQAFKLLRLLFTVFGLLLGILLIRHDALSIPELVLYLFAFEAVALAGYSSNKYHHALAMAVMIAMYVLGCAFATSRDARNAAGILEVGSMFAFASRILRNKSKSERR